jgi:hypothetical protein
VFLVAQLPSEVIAAFTAAKYTGDHPDRLKIREHIAQLWAVHEPLADRHFVEEFCSGDDARLHQRYWEMALTARCTALGFELSSADEGPDLKACKDGVCIWIEAIAPDPGARQNRLPKDYLDPYYDEPVARMVPHQAILLRWTAAVREKQRKHLEYLDRGLVSSADPYVIAVSSGMLGIFGFTGVSQFPAALEAVFPIGPYGISINSRTLEKVGEGHQFRPSVLNANQANVSTDNFRDPAYAGVSAVLACHAAPTDVAWRRQEWVAVHNPLSKNPVPAGFLGADAEYFVRDHGDHLEIRSKPA